MDPGVDPEAAEDVDQPEVGARDGVVPREGPVVGARGEARVVVPGEGDGREQQGEARRLLLAEPEQVLEEQQEEGAAEEAVRARSSSPP